MGRTRSRSLRPEQQGQIEWNTGGGRLEREQGGLTLGALKCPVQAVEPAAPLTNVALQVLPFGQVQPDPDRGLRLGRAQTKTRTKTRSNKTTAKHRQQKSPPGEPDGDV